MSDQQTGPVLVATNLSARDDRAIDRAVMLARHRGVELVVVHVVKPGSRKAEDAERARTELAEVLPDGVDARLCLPIGSAPQEITRVAGETGAQMIVTGVARFNDIGDYFLGTSVDHILRHAKVPVLVVKRRPHAPYAKLLAATDLSETSAGAIAVAGALFPDRRMRVVHGWHVPFAGWQKAVHVRDETETAAKKALIAFVAESGFPEPLRDRIEPLTLEGGAERAVIDAIESYRPDLLVLGTQGCGGFRQATLGSTASALLSSAPCDALVVPPAC
ncbi:universal stress protein [Croceicoccus bisphenolivorans]|uniref:universal stress protein n=1 Tax=Croceicoccus bisphenolivorans TaxID=1783232 RepID=UPI00082D3F2D|nr:universal stress protein [Croceicoccus bisphenolivorans]